MEYHGKLFGKVGNKYFDTGYTTDNYDALEQKVDNLAEEVLKLNLADVSNRRELLLDFSHKLRKLLAFSHYESLERYVDLYEEGKL